VLMILGENLWNESSSILLTSLLEIRLLNFLSSTTVLRFVYLNFRRFKFWRWRSGRGALDHR
jgi:hypothetical protein